MRYYGYNLAVVGGIKLFGYFDIQSVCLLMVGKVLSPGKTQARKPGFSRAGQYSQNWKKVGKTGLYWVI